MRDWTIGMTIPAGAALDIAREHMVVRPALIAMLFVENCHVFMARRA